MSANITSLRPHLETLSSLPFQVMCLQEVRAEVALQHTFRRMSRARGKETHFGDAAFRRGPENPRGGVACSALKHTSIRKCPQVELARGPPPVSPAPP